MIVVTVTNNGSKSNVLVFCIDGNNSNGKVNKEEQYVESS